MTDHLHKTWLPSGSEVSIDTRENVASIRIEDNGLESPQEAALAYFMNYQAQYPDVHRIYVHKKTYQEERLSNGRTIRHKERNNTYDYGTQKLFDEWYLFQDKWESRDREKVFKLDGSATTYAELKALRQKSYALYQEKQKREQATRTLQRTWGQKARLEYIDAMSPEDMRAALKRIATHDVSDDSAEILGGVLDAIMRVLTGIRDTDMPKELEEGIDGALVNQE